MTTVETFRGDITAFDGDAIVNAANAELRGGGGVDGAIHAAGGPSILAECRAIALERGPLATGEVVVTGAGDLDVRLIIHAVGPIWPDHDPAEAAALLATCYTNSLDIAHDRECRSIAFPNISTGVYAYPKPLAAEVAIDAVKGWVTEHPTALDTVVFVCFDAENADLYRRLL